MEIRGIEFLEGISGDRLSTYALIVNWFVRFHMVEYVRPSDNVLSKYQQYQLTKLPGWKAVGTEQGSGDNQQFAAKLAAAFKSSGATELVALPLPFWIQGEQVGCKVDFSPQGVQALLRKWAHFEYALIGVKERQEIPTAGCVFDWEDYSVAVGNQDFLETLFGDVERAMEEFTVYAYDPDWKKSGTFPRGRRDLESVDNALRLYNDLNDYGAVIFPVL